MEMIHEILTSKAVITAIVGIFGTLLTMIVDRVAGAIEAATGLRIEREHREALHEAIKSGVESAYRHGPAVAVGTLRAHVVQHLRESVPDAMKALTPGDGVLDRIIERYSRDAINRLAAEPK